MDETKKHFIDNNSNDILVIKDKIIEITKRVIFYKLTIDYDNDELCNEIDHIAEEISATILRNLMFMLRFAVEKIKGIENGNL